MNLCPICKEPAVRTCKCPRLDSCCKNNHEWHFCPVHHDKVNLGESDHAKSDCTCTLTDEWLGVYDKAVKDGEDFKKSFWWRISATGELPYGVNTEDPRVIAAIKDIKIRLE